MAIISWKSKPQISDTYYLKVVFISATQVVWYSNWQCGGWMMPNRGFKTVTTTITGVNPDATVTGWFGPTVSIANLGTELSSILTPDNFFRFPPASAPQTFYAKFTYGLDQDGNPIFYGVLLDSDPFPYKPCCNHNSPCVNNYKTYYNQTCCEDECEPKYSKKKCGCKVFCNENYGHYSF
jgi:hypothetical protein